MRSKIEFMWAHTYFGRGGARDCETDESLHQGHHDMKFLGSHFKSGCIADAALSLARLVCRMTLCGLLASRRESETHAHDALVNSHRCANVPSALAP